MTDNDNSKLPTATAQSAGERRPYKRRFSNYLLNKSLQLRYIGFVTILSAIICSSLGYLIWKQADQASSSILDRVEAQYDDDLADEIDSKLSSDDSKLIRNMALIGVGLVIVLSFFLLIMTHKVAGPLYKVSSYFNKMARGRLGPTYPLRKGDMLQDFYAKFEDMHGTVRTRFQADNDLVERLLRACDDAGVSRDGALGAALDDLEAHHKTRDEALA